MLVAKTSRRIAQIAYMSRNVYEGCCSLGCSPMPQSGSNKDRAEGCVDLASSSCENRRKQKLKGGSGLSRRWGVRIWAFVVLGPDRGVLVLRVSQGPSSIATSRLVVLCWRPQGIRESQSPVLRSWRNIVTETLLQDVHAEFSCLNLDLIPDRLPSAALIRLTEKISKDKPLWS